MYVLFTQLLVKSNFKFTAIIQILAIFKFSTLPTQGHSDTDSRQPNRRNFYFPILLRNIHTFSTEIQLKFSKNVRRSPNCSYMYQVQSINSIIPNIHGIFFRNARSKHTLPDLPYDFNALEPVISRDIMNLHHQKHHQTYVTNLNAAEEKLRAAVEKGDVR